MTDSPNKSNVISSATPKTGDGFATGSCSNASTSRRERQHSGTHRQHRRRPLLGRFSHPRGQPRNNHCPATAKTAENPVITPRNGISESTRAGTLNNHMAATPIVSTSDASTGITAPVATANPMTNRSTIRIATQRTNRHRRELEHRQQHHQQHQRREPRPGLAAESPPAGPASGATAPPAPPSAARRTPR